MSRDTWTKKPATFKEAAFILDVSHGRLSQMVRENKIEPITTEPMQFDRFDLFRAGLGDRPVPLEYQHGQPENKQSV